MKLTQIGSPLGELLQRRDDVKHQSRGAQLDVVVLHRGHAGIHAVGGQRQRACEHEGQRSELVSFPKLVWRSEEQKYDTPPA